MVLTASGDLVGDVAFGVSATQYGISLITKRGVLPMSNLVVIEFDNEEAAFDMRAELAKMQKEYLIEMDDVVVVTKNEKGKVKLHQALNLTAAGAVGGSFWGMLIGMIFLNPLLGAAVGAGAGALSGQLRDIGISDEFMKELGRISQRERRPFLSSFARRPVTKSSTG